MGTIADLNVSAGVDPSGIRAGLEEGLRMVESWKRELRVVPESASITRDAEGLGTRTAVSLLEGLRAGFSQNEELLRQSLFRGLTSPEQAKAVGALNAAEFNAGILRGINQLAESGQLSAKLRTELVGELKAAGLQAGDALRGAIATKLVETDLNIKAAVDPTGIRVGLEEGLQMVEQWRGEALAMVDRIDLVPGGLVAGEQAAAALVKGLRTGFDQNAAEIKESLFRGLVSTADADTAGKLNAAEFNAGLLGGINQLAGSGQLTARLRTELVGELKAAGLQAGEALQSAIANQLVETQGAISNLNIKAGVDPSGIRVGLEESLRMVEQWKREATAIINRVDPAGAGGSAAGEQIAKNLVVGLRAGFDQNAAQIKESLFRGLSSPGQATALGKLNAAEFNAGLLRGINQLAESGQLTARLRTSLVNELKSAGLQAGDALKGAIATKLVETQGALQRTGAVATDALGNKGVRAASAFAFGLEAVARGGVGAETGMKRMLGSVAQFAGFFGAGGFVVAGFAAAALAVTNYFTHARDEIVKTREKFIEEINRIVNAGDQLALVSRLRDLELGTPAEPDKGLNALRARLEAARRVIPLTAPAPAESSFAAAKIGGGAVTQFEGAIITAARKALRELEPQVRQLEDQRKILINRINNPPPARRPITGLTSEISVPTIGKEAKDAARDAKQAAGEFLATLAALVTSSEQLIGAEDNAIVTANLRLIEAYDKVGEAIDRQKDKLGPYAVQLRKVRDEIANSPIMQVILGVRGPTVGITPAELPEVPLPNVNRPIPQVRTDEFSKLDLALAGFKNSIIDSARDVRSQWHKLMAALVQDFTPAGVAAAVFGGILDGMAPLFDALREPLRLVGEILAKALAPILKAIFPIFKLLAIAATYVGEVLFKIAGAILTGIGNLIKGIGRFINWLLPGNPANGIVKAGQALIDLGAGFRAGADELRRGRDDLRNLEWGTALDNTAAAANRAAEALDNVPAGWNAALAALTAGRGTTIPTGAPGAPTLPSGGKYNPPTFGGGIGSNPLGGLPYSPIVQIPEGGIVIDGNRDGRAMARDLLNGLMQLSLEQFGTTSRWAEVTP